MKIEYNKVTWYSKLAAVILFLITFYIAFYAGAQFQALKDQTPDTSVHINTANI